MAPFLAPSASASPASAAALLPKMALLLVSTVSASKDSDYYPPGQTNPLVNEKMYWKDAGNVLQDLSKFKALYVQYHGCVWSKYGSRYGQGEDHHDADDGGAVCGGADEDEERWWYLGKTQCFKANAAFSLYGILEDDDEVAEVVDEEVAVEYEATQGGGKNGARRLSDSNCRKGTFINSFFSTYGVESFAGPLGIDTYSVNSYCSTTAPNDDAVLYDYDVDNGSRDEAVDNWKAYTSFGTGCLHHRFVSDKYQGAFCNGQDQITTMDTLSDYNEQLEANQCTQIYFGANSGNDDDEQDDDGNGDEDKEDENMNYASFYGADPITLLKYSKSCSIRQYPHDCPDPHGIKSNYAAKTDRYLQWHGTAGAPNTKKSTGEKIVLTVGSLLLAGAAAMAGLAFWTHHRSNLKPKVAANDLPPAVEPVKSRSLESAPTGGDSDDDSNPTGDGYGDLGKASSFAHTQSAPVIRSISSRIVQSAKKARIVVQTFAEAEEEVDDDDDDDEESRNSEAAPPEYRAATYFEENASDSKSGDDMDGLDPPAAADVVPAAASGAGAAPSVASAQASVAEYEGDIVYSASGVASSVASGQVSAADDEAEDIAPAASAVADSSVASAQDILAPSASGGQQSEAGTEVSSSEDSTASAEPRMNWAGSSSIDHAKPRGRSFSESEVPTPVSRSKKKKTKKKRPFLSKLSKRFLGDFSGN